MRRDQEEIEAQVYNDPVLKRNQKLYDPFVQDLKVCGCCLLKDLDDLKSPCLC